MARVLVVDDDLDILSAVQEALAEEGWDVVTAASAEDAAIAGRFREIDVVLCDVLLNDGRHGRSVKEAFGNALGLAQVPFAFMTASPREASKLRDEYVLRKPFGTSEVVAVLNDALCDRARKRSHQPSALQ